MTDKNRYYVNVDVTVEVAAKNQEEAEKEAVKAMNIGLGHTNYEAGITRVRGEEIADDYEDVKIGDECPNCKRGTLAQSLPSKPHNEVCPNCGWNKR